MKSAMDVQVAFWLLVIALTGSLIMADCESQREEEADLPTYVGSAGYVVETDTIKGTFTTGGLYEFIGDRWYPVSQRDEEADQIDMESVVVIDGEKNTYSIGGSTIEIEFPAYADSTPILPSVNETADFSIGGNISKTSDIINITDASTVSVATAISIYADHTELVSLDWSDGKLRLIGDPNNYDEAAKVFLTEAMYGAAYDLVANDPNAIRRLVESGAICKAMGHKWKFGGLMSGDWPPVEYQYCVRCDAEQTRTHKEYWTEWE